MPRGNKKYEIRMGIRVSRKKQPPGLPQKLVWPLYLGFVLSLLLSEACKITRPWLRLHTRSATSRIFAKKTICNVFFLH